MTPPSSVRASPSGGGHPDLAPSRRRDVLGAAAIAVGTFAVYAAGAARTIYVGDSGDLATAVHVLGVPHPTGYPLYVLLGKLWTLLVPVGSIAYRLSLFSAAAAALACAVLFLVLRGLAAGRAAALTGALCLAFAPSFWGEANVQRVYALNALGLAVAMLLASAWARRRTADLFALTVFAATLGAANHTYMAVFLAAFVLVALVTDARAVLQPRAIGLAVLAVVAGLLPYIYLPIAAAFDPPMLWGEPLSVSGFLDIVLRRDYWARAWVASPADLVAVVADYARTLGAELGWLGVPLAVVGAGAVIRRRRGIALLVAAAMLGNLATMALHGAREDLFVWHRYYIPSLFMVALLAGLGADALTARVGAAARLLPLAVPALLLASGWARFDRSQHRMADDFARTLLDALPPHATLQAADDNVLFPLLYLTLVDGYRSDVRVGVLGSVPLPEAATFDPQATPVFFTHVPEVEDPALAIVPAGLAFRLWRADQPAPPFASPPDELPGEDDPRIPKDDLSRHLIAAYHFTVAIGFEQSDWRRAEAHLRRATTAAADDDVLLVNIALLYLRNGLYDESLEPLARAARINSRLLPGSEISPADLLAQVRGERERLAKLEATLAPHGVGADDPEYHRRLAQALAERGESLAARGHVLRAERAD